MSKAKEHIRFYCKSGSRYADKHAVRIDDKGHKTLVKTGEKTDIYAKIQSHKDECDIELILQRAEVEGYEILDKRQVISGDVTAVPKSLMEAQMMLQNMENDFNKLPIDVRRQFNFSFNEYVAEAGNDLNSWSKKMGYIKDAAPDPSAKVEAAPTEGGEE